MSTTLHGVPDPSRSPAQRLVELLKIEHQDTWVVVIYATVAGLLSLIVPIAVQSLVGTLAFTNLLQPLAVLTFIVFGVLATAGVIRALKALTVERIQQRIFLRVALDLTHRLPRVRAEVFDSENGPELVNRFFDVLTIQKAISAFLLDGVTIVLQVVIGMLVLGFYHPALLAFDIALTISLLIVVFVFGRGATSTSIQESKAKYAVAAWLEEIARHKRLFRSSSGASAAVDGVLKGLEQYLGYRRKHFTILLRQLLGTMGIQVLASTTLLGLGGYLLVDRQLTLGQLVAAELIVATVTSSLAKTGKLLETYYDLIAALDKIGRLTDLPLEDAHGHAHLPDHCPLSVTLHEVAFTYEGRDGHAVQFPALNLPAGSRTALIGRDGDGKSTLADLLHGTRRPSRGRLALNETDVREIAPIEQRNHTVLITQDIEFFDASIRANLTLGREDIDAATIRRACETVDLADDIDRLAVGLDTRIAPTGAPFSRSFLRRVVLARAILSKPGLIILDGGLAELDPPMRERIVTRLFAADAPWTVIYMCNESDSVSARCERTIVLRPVVEPVS